VKPVNLPRLRCALLGLLPLRARGTDVRQGHGREPVRGIERKPESVPVGNLNQKIMEINKL